MKKLFLFAALFAAVAMNAQTIVMDGKKADWADVPMLNDPGTSPVFKMVVPQTGLTLPADAAFCAMVERTTTQKGAYAGYPIIYVDADKNKDTKEANKDPWYCPAFGPDYEMATWDEGNTFGANEEETMHEMCIVKSNFASASLPFAGSFNAWMLFILKEDWSEYTYLPTDPSAAEWKWNATAYHPIMVKPFTYAEFNGTHSASTVYASHEALTIGSTINMNVSGSANDVELWASWAVELKNPGKYTIKANISSTNTASVDLKLVNTATNKVVASFASEDLVEGTEVEAGEWDLSAVPAGKYMLRFSNHVQWSEMKLNSLTFTAAGETTIDNIATQQNATKVIRNGQMVILRDGKAFNALGAEVK